MNPHFLESALLILKILGAVTILFVSWHIIDYLVKIGPQGRKALSEAQNKAVSRSPISVGIAGGFITVMVMLFFWALLDPKSFISLIHPSILQHLGR